MTTRRQKLGPIIFSQKTGSVPFRRTSPFACDRVQKDQAVRFLAVLGISLPRHPLSDILQSPEIGSLVVIKPWRVNENDGASVQHKFNCLWFLSA